MHHLLDPSLRPHTTSDTPDSEWDGRIDPIEFEQLRESILSTNSHNTPTNIGDAFSGSPVRLVADQSLKIPNIEPYLPNTSPYSNVQQQGNPQTDRFLAMLELPHLWTIPFTSATTQPASPSSDSTKANPDPNPNTINEMTTVFKDAAEIDIDVI